MHANAGLCGHAVPAGACRLTHTRHAAGCRVGLCFCTASWPAHTATPMLPIEHRPRRACSRSRARYVASAACPGCRPTRVTNAPSGVSGVMTGASLMTSTACLRCPAHVWKGYEPYPTLPYPTPPAPPASTARSPRAERSAPGELAQMAVQRSCRNAAAGGAPAHAPHEPCRARPRATAAAARARAAAGSGSGSAAAGLQPGAGPVAPAGNNDNASLQEPPLLSHAPAPCLR